MNHRVGVTILGVLVFGACVGMGDKSAGDGRPKWMLELHDPGSAATLENPRDRPELYNVKITSATVPTDFHIQLRKAGFSVTDFDSLTLSFRARADSARPVSVGIGMGHPPWDGLGFYLRTSVDTGWKQFTESFVLPKAEPNAQLMFNLGAHHASVQLDSIILRRTRTGEIVKF